MHPADGRASAEPGKLPTAGLVVRAAEMCEEGTRRLVNEVLWGDTKRLIVRTPKGIHHGRKCVGQEAALVANLPDQVYDHDSPDERGVDPHESDMPCVWQRRDI